MTSSLTRSSARAESGRSESRPGVSPRESISEKKATALNAVAFFVDLPPLLQRRIESATERCCGRDRRPPAAFYLGLCRLRGTLSLPAPHDCAAGGPFLAAAAVRVMAFCRRNCSSLPRRKLESDAEVFVAEPQLSGSDSQIDPPKSRITAAFGLFPRKSLHRFASLSLKSRIDAHKSA